MFVETADGNYVLARLAFFENLDFDFFWLSLHALEKYFKAALLMNGKSSKSYGHNLITLYQAVLAIDSRLPIGPFYDPQIEGWDWRQETVESYLQRLNLLGSAENRYGTYGYSLMPDDLLKVDQLVWFVRRCAHPFSYTVGNGDRQRTIDHVDHLVRDPRQWNQGAMPVERLIESPETNLARQQFLRLNAPFAPGGNHSLRGLRWSSANSPLADWFMILSAKDATAEQRKDAAEILIWAIDNIKFKDEKAIRAEIDKHLTIPATNSKET